MSHANNFKDICSHLFSLQVTLMPKVRAYFLFLSTGSVSRQQAASAHTKVYSIFGSHPFEHENVTTVTASRCLKTSTVLWAWTLSTQTLRFELAISGFLKWVNHWKDILRLQSAAPSHECHYQYLPHIESLLLRSQASSGWYISGRRTLVVGPAAV